MASAAAVTHNSYAVNHTDVDFGYTTITVLKKNYNYNSDDHPVVYFCFICLGLVIPLRLGGILVFNP